MDNWNDQNTQIAKKASKKKSSTKKQEQPLLPEAEEIKVEYELVKKEPEKPI